MGLTITSPPPVDRFGNISLQGRSGISWVVQWQDDGVPRDVSAASLFFEVDGVLRVELGPAATAATFTGAIDGAALTISAYTFGAIAVGMVLQGAVADTVVEAATENPLIWQVSPTQTFASGALAAFDPSLRTLQLDDAQVAALPLTAWPAGQGAARYVIRDETGDVPAVPLSGLICVTGFTIEPPTGPT